MDIATYRAIKEHLLHPLTPSHRAMAETHIAYTLSILQQETMSREALAVIISYTKELHDRTPTTVG